MRKIILNKINMINKVILLGNLGQDPEIRSTSDGREIANFSMATTESWKDKNTGERKDRTEWHRVVVFSQGLVGIVKNYVKKGTKLYIEGALQNRKWTDNNGIDKYTTEIVLQNFNSTLQIMISNNKATEEKPKEGKTTTIKLNEMDAIPDQIPF